MSDVSRNFENFWGTGNLNGAATLLSNGDLRLTPATPDQAGSFFFNIPLDFGEYTSFQAFFSFKITGSGGAGGGADGITLIFQSDAEGTDALGDQGGNIGYGDTLNENGEDGIRPSFAIEFDTYKNSGLDPNNNHIGVNTHGSVQSLTTATVQQLDLNSGHVVNTWVNYNAINNELDVFLSNGTTQPTAPVLSFDLDDQNLDLDDILGPDAYLGLSAATGAGFGQHDILNLAFETLEPIAIDIDVLLGNRELDDTGNDFGQVVVPEYTGALVEGQILFNPRDFELVDNKYIFAATGTLFTELENGSVAITTVTQIIFEPGSRRTTVTGANNNQSNFNPLKADLTLIDVEGSFPSNLATLLKTGTKQQIIDALGLSSQDQVDLRLSDPAAGGPIPAVTVKASRFSSLSAVGPISTVTVQAVNDDAGQLIKALKPDLSDLKYYNLDATQVYFLELPKVFDPFTFPTINEIQGNGHTTVRADKKVKGVSWDLRSVDLKGIEDILGTVKDDFIAGSDAADDTIWGDLGNDTLLGARGDDILYGGHGCDFLDGGAGNDIYYGGHGPDTFVIGLGKGIDILKDFSQADVIGLSDGLRFSDLVFSGQEIKVGTEVLARVLGCYTPTLTQADFVTV